MYDFLNFPERFQVKKKLDKDRYLAHANLTPAEKQRMGTYMKYVNILYDIVLPDSSEMFVFEVEADFPEFKKAYFVQKFVSAFAQSFPYQCLLIMRYRSAIKLVLPIVRENKVNNSRMVVEDYLATSLIRLDGYSVEKYSLIPDFRNDIEKAKSAAQLFYLWCSDYRRLYNSVPSDVMKNEAFFEYERQQLDEELYEEKLFRNAISLDEDLIEDEYDDYSDEDSVDGEMFLNCFRYYSWKLYPCYKAYRDAEAISEEDLVQQWIEEYCVACNRMYKDSFSRYLTAKEIRSIAEGFYEKNEPEYEDCTIFDLSELKEYLFLPEYDSESDEDFDDDFSEDD